ncbi:hypothetical protein [Butyrivibrio sp. VCB2006]|uniref:hypothetical protein n=1 Tax=Butyrivibrio sp. VCB2006 TaxID=1280679 RepID=UPI00040C99B2|nr:hypothetical protein [Butyrivibrio sp. VCB2006]
MSKDFEKIEDLELQDVNGGKNLTAKERDLVYRGEKTKKQNLLFSGDKKKAINLGAKNSEIDGKTIVGDFADKGTMC